MSINLSYVLWVAAFITLAICKKLFYKKQIVESPKEEIENIIVEDAKLPEVLNLMKDELQIPVLKKAETEHIKMGNVYMPLRSCATGTLELPEERQELSKYGELQETDKIDSAQQQDERVLLFLDRHGRIERTLEEVPTAKPLDGQDETPQSRFCRHLLLSHEQYVALVELGEKMVETNNCILNDPTIRFPIDEKDPAIKFFINEGIIEFNDFLPHKYFSLPNKRGQLLENYARYQTERELVKGDFWNLAVIATNPKKDTKRLYRDKFIQCLYLKKLIGYISNELQITNDGVKELRRRAEEEFRGLLTKDLDLTIEQYVNLRPLVVEGSCAFIIDSTIIESLHGLGFVTKDDYTWNKYISTNKGKKAIEKYDDELEKSPLMEEDYKFLSCLRHCAEIAYSYEDICDKTIWKLKIKGLILVKIDYNRISRNPYRISLTDEGHQSASKKNSEALKQAVDSYVNGSMR